MKKYRFSIKPKRIRGFRAFSLLEMMIAMAITGILMVLLTNVLATSVIVSQKVLARSIVREEIAGAMELIAADIRKASTVTNCSGSMDEAVCDLVIVDRVTWGMCEITGTNPLRYQICKKDAAGNILYATSPNLTLSEFSFEPGFEYQGTETQRNILVTIVGGHENPAYSVNFVVNQTAISTRNYYLIIR